MSTAVNLSPAALAHMKKAMRAELQRRQFVIGDVRVLETRYDCDRKAVVVVYSVTYHDGRLLYRGTATWPLNENFRPVSAGPDLHVGDPEELLSPELSWVEAALQRSPDDHDLLQERGYRLFQLHRFEEAYTAFRLAELRVRGYAPTLYWLGRTELELGMFRNAELSFRAALKVDSNNTKTLCALAQSLLRQGESERALAAVASALSHDPDDVDAVALRIEIGEVLKLEAEVTALKAEKRRKSAKRAAVKRLAAKRAAAKHDEQMNRGSAKPRRTTRSGASRPGGPQQQKLPLFEEDLSQEAN